MEVDDAWQCEYCTAQMDGAYKARRFYVSPELLNYLRAPAVKRSYRELEAAYDGLLLGLAAQIERDANGS